MLTALLIFLLWVCVYAIIVGLVTYIVQRIVDHFVGGMASTIVRYVVWAIWAIFAIWILISIITMLVGAAGTHPRVLP